MPFGFCTREKKWCEFAEDVENGPTTNFLKNVVHFVTRLLKVF